MPIPFQKVRPGERMPGINHLTWNGFIDAAVDFQQRKLSKDSEFLRQTPFGTVIKIKNNTGSDQDRFAVLAYSSGLLYKHADNANWFEQPCLVGTTPSTSTDFGRFVILQEPIKAGKIGDGLIAGYSQVTLKVNSSSDLWADILNSDATTLNSGFGSAKIVDKDSGTGTGKTAIVQLGAGSDWDVRGTIASDCAPDTSQTLTIYTGAFGSEATATQTVSVRNASDCTIKSGSTKIHTARYSFSASGWQFIVGRTV